MWLPFGPRLGRDAHREPAQHLHGGALRDIGGFCARRLAPIPSPPLPFSLIPFFLDIPPHHPQPHVRTYDIYERMSVVRPRSSCADRVCVCACEPWIVSAVTLLGGQQPSVERQLSALLGRGVTRTRRPTEPGLCRSGGSVVIRT